MTESYGAKSPGWLDSAVMAATAGLPDNWLGLRLAIGLRRIVTMRLSDDDGLDVVRWGLRMRLHPLHNGCEKNALFTPQMYEAPERKELEAEIDKAKAVSRTFVFVDIGANVGLFSFVVASYAGADADILAVEPEPENLRRLRFNIAANPGIPIRVFPFALGERAGRAVLEINQRDRGGTRSNPFNSGDPTGLPIVECRSLLDVLKQEEVHSIDALKIDVEGNEDTILVPFFAAADATLRPNLIIIEDTRSSWRNDLFAVLAQHGYEIAIRTRLNVVLRRSAS